MRQTRFMSRVFLALSIAFFFVPDFRQGLEVPILIHEEMPSGWLDRAGKLPPQMLEDAARTAEQQRDGRTLAFVAMRAPNGGQEGLRLADRAVALDPQLAWVYPKIYYNVAPRDRGTDELKQMIRRLETWDPDNSFPYLLEGGDMVDQRRGHFPGAQEYDKLASETRWREVMAKAFAAPRYDSYALRRFDLDRAWLRQHGFDKPAVVILTVAYYPLPNLLSVRLYENLLIKKLGKEAEAAGRMPEALGYYWTVAHMGERLQLNGIALIERLMGSALQMDAYEHLIPLLRRTGRVDEAATVDYALKQVRQRLDAVQGKDPLAQSSNYNWAALMVDLFAASVLVFAVLTTLSVVYVNAKRWVRPEIKGRLYQILTVAENYLPVALFLACVGLYFSYYPYVQNFHHYMTASGEIHDFEPLFYNVLPTAELVPGRVVLPLGNPFRPYVWYALACLLVVTLARIPFRHGRSAS